MSYAVLPRLRYDAPPISVRPRARTDAEPIRHWRNGQLAVLRQKAPITEAQQAAYFDTVVVPDFAADRPRNILFAIEEAGRMIGYGGLVHIAWDDRRAEVSFLLETGLAGTPAETQTYLPAFHTAMKTLAFQDLGFVKLTLETFAFRHDFLAVYDSIGYRQAGRWTAHVYHQGRFWDSFLHECLNPEQTTP